MGNNQNQTVLDMTITPINCGSCDCLHKIKPVSLPTWVGEGHTSLNPSLRAIDSYGSLGVYSWWVAHAPIGMTHPCVYEQQELDCV